MRTDLSDSIEYAVLPRHTHQDRELLAKGFPGGVFWMKHSVPYVVFPDWDPAPFPFLNDFGIRLFDETADLSEHIAAPIVQLFDSAVDET